MFIILSVKRRFVEGIKNKDFLMYLGILLLKSLLFIILISDDKANGINLKQVFYSMPPFLVWICFNGAFLSLGLFFNEKKQKWAFWTLDLLFTLIVIGDMWYFRSNAIFLNFHMFKMTDNLENLGSSIISMFRMIDIVFIIDLIVLAIRNVKVKSNIVTYKRNIVGAFSIFLVSAIYLGYVHIKVDKLQVAYSNQFIFRTCWAPNQTMGNLSPIGYHFFDGIEYYKQSKPYIFSEDEKRQTEDILSSLKENNEDNEYAGIFKGKNLILIQWESLETFIVNKSIDGQEITPNLNKLLNNSLYFDNFYEQTHNSTSSDGEMITNTSAFPVLSGSTAFRFPTNEYTYSLPNIFKNMGYETLASHPDKGAYWNWMTNLKSVGYDTCLDSTDYDTSDVINLGVSDESYLKQFNEKITALKEPFLAYTITLTSHSPFDMPMDKRELKLPENLEGTKIGGYFQSINYTDKYIGEFIESLDEQGLLDNSVVVFYGDHEGVHKFYNDDVENTKGLEDWMKTNNRKVPLVIYSKDLKGETISLNGGQVDTLPTLAYLFGAAKEEYNNNLVLGRNLLNTKKDYVLLPTKEVINVGLEKEEESHIQKLLEISDKMIRGNYFRKGGGLNE